MTSIFKNNKKPVLKVRAYSSEILAGDSLLVTWETDKIDSLVMAERNLILPGKGFIYLRPEKPSSYKFTAFKGKNKTTRVVSVNVLFPYVYLTNLPAKVSDEEFLTFRWNSYNTESVSITGVGNDLPAKGSATLKLDTTTVIEVTATNKFGVENVTKYTVDVYYKEFVSSTKKIIRGENAGIRWKFKKCRQVFVSGVSCMLEASDSIRVSPDSTSEYYVTALYNNGETTSTRLRIEVTQPYVASWSARRLAPSDENVTLSWNVVGVKSVNIKGYRDSLPPMGKAEIKRSDESFFTMEVVSPFLKYSKKYRVAGAVRHRSFITGMLSYNQVPKNERIDNEIFAVDISRYPAEIKFYVLMVDSSGHYVSNLAQPYGKGDIAKRFFPYLKEYQTNGEMNMVENFRVREFQLSQRDTANIAMVMDYSGSMGGYVDSMEKACKIFISGKTNLDKISMIRFDDSIARECPLMQDQMAILKKVKFGCFPKFGKATALNAGMDEGLSALDYPSKNREMIVITDGQENASFKYFGKKAVFAQQVARKARNNNIRINTVGLGDGVNETLLKFLSVLTGGSYYNVYKASDIINVMNELPVLKMNYYEITYKPPQYEGLHMVSLGYNNNQGRVKSSSRDYFIGEGYNLEKIETTNCRNCNLARTNWKNKQQFTSPQAAAFFDFDESALKKEDHARLDGYVKFLNENPKSVISVNGFSDMKGPEERCKEISDKRAAEVVRYIVDRGIEASRVLGSGYGKECPVWGVEDLEWKAKENRRVELVIFQ